MADFTRCISALNKAAGRELSADELQGMFDKIQKTARDLKAGRIEPANGPQNLASPEGLIQHAAEIEAQNMIAEAERKARNAVQDAKTVATRTAEIEQMKAAGMSGLEAVQRLIENRADGRTDMFSLEAKYHGVSRYLQSRVQDTWAAMDRSFLEYLQREDKFTVLLREIRGEYTGDAIAKKGAKVYLDAAEEARGWFNERGGKIGHLENWGGPQHHSQDLVARAAAAEFLQSLPPEKRVLAYMKDKVPGREQNQRAWVDFVMPLVDRSKYVDPAGNHMSDSAVRTFLEKSWESIATGGVNKIEPGQPSGKGSVANRHSEARQIHFKDADAQIKYWKRFGDRTVPEVLLGHLDTMAKDIAFLEHFGPNPDATFRFLRDTEMKAAIEAAPEKRGNTESQLFDLNRAYNYAAGITTPVANQRIANTFQAARNLASSGMLGGASLASLFGDKPMFEAMARLNNLPSMQLWQNEMRLLSGKKGGAQERRLLRRQGLMLEYMQTSLHRFGDDFGSSSLTGRLANGVTKVTALGWTNDMRRGSWALTAMDAIGHLTRTKEWASIDADDTRLLHSYGITETDWRVWKLAELADLGHGNDTALTPEAIMKIPDEQLHAEFPERFQEVRDAVASKTAELSRRNSQELQWISGRISKFDDARDALNRWVKDRQSRRLKANEDATGPMLERMALLDAQRERAKLQADMEADFNRLSTQGEMRAFLNAVEDGASADLTDVGGDFGRGGVRSEVRGALNAAQSIGRRYGRAQGRLEQRMREIQTRIGQMDRQAGSSANADAKLVKKKADAMASDLADFIKRSQERQASRQAVIDKVTASEGQNIAQAARDIRRDAMVKFLGALTSESHLAVIEPGWHERAIMYGGIQRGTMKGELIRSFYQFKAFPFTQFEKMIELGASRPTMGGKIGFLAMVPVMQTIAGAMLIQTQEILAGKDPRPMWDWKFMAAAFLKGGSLGLYGDFLFSQSGTTRHGSGPLEAAAGPVIGSFADLVSLAAKAPGLINAGKDPQVAAKALNIAKGYIPGQNLWYTKAATDHLIFQAAQEALNPGYLSSMRSRNRAEFGNDFWWAPGEATPDRAPDIGAAFDSRN